MMIERILKIILSGGLAILTALIAYANIHDPGANLKYVEHVLSMDTVAPDSPMMDHPLPVPLIWRIAFWSIVTLPHHRAHPPYRDLRRSTGLRARLVLFRPSVAS